MKLFCKSLLLLSIIGLCTNSLTAYQIFIKLLSGQTLTVQVERDFTVGQAKQLIAKTLQATGIPFSDFKWLFAGKVLNNDATALADLELEKNNATYLIIVPPAEGQAVKAPQKNNLYDIIYDILLKHPSEIATWGLQDAFEKLKVQRNGITPHELIELYNAASSLTVQTSGTKHDPATEAARQKLLAAKKMFGNRDAVGKFVDLVRAQIDPTIAETVIQQELETPTMPIPSLYEITVNAIDGRSITLSVNDDLTVKQVKEMIAEQLNQKVNNINWIIAGRIPDDTQKISTLRLQAEGASQVTFKQGTIILQKGLTLITKIENVFATKTVKSIKENALSNIRSKMGQSITLDNIEFLYVNTLLQDDWAIGRLVDLSGPASGVQVREKSPRMVKLTTSPAKKGEHREPKRPVIPTKQSLSLEDSLTQLATALNTLTTHLRS